MSKSKYELNKISFEIIEKMQKNYNEISLNDYMEYNYLPDWGGWSLRGINYLKDRGTR